MSEIRYPSPGKCIYCGAEPPIKLNDEHVIALGLDGKLVLEDASCTRCGEITGSGAKGVVGIENEVLGKMFVDFRTYKKIRSRRPKKRRTELRLGIGHMNDPNFRWLNLPLDKHPLSIKLPIFPPSSFLRGEPPSEDIPVEGFIEHYHKSMVDKLRNIGYDARIMQWMHFGLFCRMPSKIGHSYAVLKLGLGSFQPFLIDIILGRSLQMSHYVGGSRGIGEPWLIEPHRLAIREYI